METAAATTAKEVSHSKPRPAVRSESLPALRAPLKKPTASEKEVPCTKFLCTGLGTRPKLNPRAMLANTCAMRQHVEHRSTSTRSNQSQTCAPSHQPQTNHKNVIGARGVLNAAQRRAVNIRNAYWSTTYRLKNFECYLGGCRRKLVRSSCAHMAAPTSAASTTARG